MAGRSRVQLGLYGLLIIGCLDGDGGYRLLIGVLVKDWDGLGRWTEIGRIVDPIHHSAQTWLGLAQLVDKLRLVATGGHVDVDLLDRGLRGCGTWPIEVHFIRLGAQRFFELLSQVRGVSLILCILYGAVVHVDLVLELFMVLHRWHMFVGLHKSLYSFHFARTTRWYSQVVRWQTNSWWMIWRWAIQNGGWQSIIQSLSRLVLFRILVHIVSRLMLNSHHILSLLLVLRRNLLIVVSVLLGLNACILALLGANSDLLAKDIRQHFWI